MMKALGLSRGGETLVTLASGQNGPQNVVVDATRAYWTNEGTAANAYADGPVMSVLLVGGTPTTLASNQNSPKAIAVDGANVYWTNAGTAADEYSTGTVARVPLAGSALPTLLASGQSEPYSIAVDATSVYWTNALGPAGGSVLKAPLSGIPDGGTPTTLASGGYPLAIAVDAANVYWTNYGVALGTVMKVALDGGKAVTLAASQDGPFGIAVGVNSVYWTDLTSGALMEATRPIVDTDDWSPFPGSTPPEEWGCAPEASARWAKRAGRSSSRLPPSNHRSDCSCRRCPPGCRRYRNRRPPFHHPRHRRQYRIPLPRLRFLQSLLHLRCPHRPLRRDWPPQRPVPPPTPLPREGNPPLVTRASDVRHEERRLVVEPHRSFVGKSPVIAESKQHSNYPGVGEVRQMLRTNGQLKLEGSRTAAGTRP